MDIETIQQIMLLIFWGALLIFGIFALFVMGTLLITFKQWASGQLVKIDHNPAVIDFGKSPIGQAINTGLTAAKDALEDNADPFISAAHQIKLLRQLHVSGFLPARELVAASVGALQTGIQLTNGIPDAKFTFEVLPDGSVTAENAAKLRPDDYPLDTPLGESDAAQG